MPKTDWFIQRKYKANYQHIICKACLGSKLQTP